MRPILLTVLPLALAACQGSETADTTTVAGNSALANIAAPEPISAPGNSASDERPISSETIDAKFTDFLQGDYLYANLAPTSGKEIAGNPMVQSGEIAAFLAAHVGKPLTVKLDTVNMFLEGPGERVDAIILRSASIGGLSADAWWASLAPAQQAAARKAAEDLAAANVEH